MVVVSKKRKKEREKKAKRHWESFLGQWKLGFHSLPLWRVEAGGPAEAPQVEGTSLCQMNRMVFTAGSCYGFFYPEVYQISFSLRGEIWETVMPELGYFGRSTRMSQKVPEVECLRGRGKLS